MHYGESLHVVWYGGLRQHVHVFTYKFYGNDGVCLALSGRLMTNISYAFRAWHVSTRVRACVRNNLKKKNRSDNFCMHLAGIGLQQLLRTYTSQWRLETGSR